MRLERDPDLVALSKNLPEWIKGHRNQTDMRVDVGHTTQTLTNLAAAGCLIALALMDGEKYVGCIIGTVGPTIHSPVLEASEHVFFVEEEYRGFRTASRMIDAFVKEAKLLGASTVCMADTSGHDERVAILYKRKNFLPQGSYYELKEK